jgi:hypothetical protein
MDSTYNPNYQGSNTDPSPACDGPIAADTRKVLETAREACRLHEIANRLADRSGR